MGRVAKIIAFCFKLLNFIFDVFQTWQYTAGGGMSGIIATIVALYRGLPYWMLPFVAVATGVVVTILLALIFKAFTAKKYEENRLQKLPRLVYDIHNRVCTVRSKLVNKTNWETIDRDAVMSPLVKVFFGIETEREIIIPDDDAITKGATKLREAGSTMSGSPSVLDTYMKEGDTSLEKALKKDLWYRILLARLDGFKPYPNDAIRNCVQVITNSSISFNNVIIFLLYSPQGLELAKELSLKTKISDTEKQRIYITTQNAEKKMNDTIDIGTTNLSTHIRDYLKRESNR